MTRPRLATLALLIVLLGHGMVSPLGATGSLSEDTAVRFLLATIQAFRTAYVEHITERVKTAGIEAKEDWSTDDRAIMLPFQFVKMAAFEIKGETKNLEIGLVSLTPIYTANFPKTEAEVAALRTLTADPSKRILTFTDGKVFKGIAGDFAIEQSCADCHNHHPNATRRDFKKGDLMGAVVVRLKKL